MFSLPFFPFWMRAEAQAYLVLVIALAILNIPGGSRLAGGKPLVAGSAIWLTFLLGLLGAVAYLPTADPLFGQIRTGLIVVLGFPLVILATRKLGLPRRLERAHPVLVVAYVWFVLWRISVIGLLPLASVFTESISVHLVRDLQWLSVPLLVWGFVVTFFGRPSIERPPMKLQKNNLHALRLLLASGVVVHHALHYSGHEGFDPGWIAAFLCVSGALIPASRASSKPSTVWAFNRELQVPPVLLFILKRVLRVWPAMLLGFYLAWAFFQEKGLSDFVHHTFMIGQVSAFSSITLEEICYAILTVLWAFGGYRKPLVIWSCLLISMVVGYQANAAIVPGTDATLNGYLGLPQYFFLGNLFWFYNDRLKRFPFALALALVVGILVLDRYVYLPPIAHQIRGLIFIGSLYAMFAYGKPILSGLQRFGDPSYSLFLYHYFPMAMLSYHYKLDFWPLFGLSYCITLAVSYLSWFGVEEPVLRLKDRFKPIRAGETVIPTVRIPEHEVAPATV